MGRDGSPLYGNMDLQTDVVVHPKMTQQMNKRIRRITTTSTPVVEIGWWHFVYITLTISFQNSHRWAEGGGVSCISPDFARRVTQKMKAGRIESGELAELVLTQQATKLTEYTSILELFIIHDCTRTDSLRMTQTQEKTHNPLFYSPLIACGA